MHNFCKRSTFKNPDKVLVTFELPNASLPCRTLLAAARRARQRATFALIKTAARLPAFRSNLGLLVESTSSLTARAADSES